MTGPVADTPLSGLSFVAFDTETTGLFPVGAQLVELSGVKFRLTGEELSTFSSLIDPGQPIPPEATAIHGITNRDVQGQPGLREVVPRFFDWAGEDACVLVAHNAPFDLSFLEVALARLGHRAPISPVLDTLDMSRQLIGEAANHQLKTLTQHLSFDDQDYHRALADSQHVRRLFLHLLSLIPDVHTWAQLSSRFVPLGFCDIAQRGKEELGQLSEDFEPLKRAIQSGLPVDLVYNNGYRADKLRRVTPQSLMLSRGNLYLSAYCHRAGAERTFRLDRIVSCELASSVPDEKR